MPTQISNKMKILLTGFEPFGKDNINVSWEVAHLLSCDNSLGLDIEIKCLPVSFKKVGQVLCDEISRIAPDILILLGQSAHRHEVNVERVAINVMDASNPDNDGFIPTDLPVCANGETAYLSNAPIKDICCALKSAGIGAKVSNSAGTYVCNTAFYEALRFNSCLSKKMIVTFIHLPSKDKSFDKLQEFKQSIEISIKTIIEK